MDIEKKLSSTRKMPSTKKEQGGMRMLAVSTVEALLAMSLFMMYGTFVIGALVLSVQSTKYPSIRQMAIRYAEEGVEATRYIRNNNISNLPDGTYGVALSGTTWSLSGTSDTISPNYSRSITISSPSTNTRLITSSVNWQDGGRSGTEMVTTQLSNWGGTVVSFNPWVTPRLVTSYDITGNDALYRLYANSGTLYAFTGKNNAGSIVSLNITSLPTITQLQSLPISAEPEDIYTTATEYYVVSTANTREVVSVNVPSASTMSVSATLNMSGNTNAIGIAGTGAYLYVTRSSGSSTLSRLRDNGSSLSIVNTYTSPNVLYDIALRGNYAYVTTNNTAQDLQIFNISNLTAAPSLAASINTPSSTTTQSLVGFYNQYLLIFTASSGIHIYDATNATVPTFITTIPVGGAYAITDFYVDTTNHYVFVTTTNPTQELQTFDFTNPTSPSFVGAFDSSVDLTSVTYDANSGYLFIGSSDNRSEIQIIAPN